MALAPGTRIGAYEITSSLGAGGMGEVYRARDGRLGRDVALKVLPPELIGDAGRLERFDREARAIAALNHPHIVTIYSTEHADGVRFLTMELVEGRTLTEMIAGGRLSLQQFLDVAVPLADALTAAHQKQITHRDLKPGNVMVSHDGRVKVLDFGLARVGSGELAEHSLAATLAPVTEHGMVVGTMPYMSPEQVEGRPLDPRSDLFSLGIIYYELLTGDRPFQAASSPALMSAILRDTPAPITDRRADVPEALSRLVARLLEKRQEDRIQTARDVYNELRHLQKQSESTSSRRVSSSVSVAPTVGIPTIAVLQFVARGGEGIAAALAEGLTEDITVGLSRFGNLRVLSSGARYALEGSVRQFGEALRVSVRIGDAQSGANVWADNYDRDASRGLFALQDEISSRVAATVGDPTGVLANAMVSAARDTPAEQQSVAQLVLAYHAYASHSHAAEHARVRGALEQALEREPSNADGWACLALLYEHEHSFGFNSQPDALDRERRAAQRAVQLDPHSQLAWVALASAHLFARDLHALRSAVERAVSINALNADLLALCAVFVSVAGDDERAMDLYRRATALKPQHPGWYHFSAINASFLRGDDDEALRAAKRINMPLMPLANLSAIAAAGHLGRAADAAPAIAALRHVAPALLEPDHARAAWGRWIWSETLLDHLVDGVRKALDLTRDGVSSGEIASGATSARPASGTQTAAAPATDTLSIAVLPFSVRGADPDADAMAIGLTEDITASLAKFPGLSVIALQSARVYKDSTLDVRQIAERLHARYILSGSARKAGDAVRVMAHVVDAHTAATLWSETYDRRVTDGDIFAVQDDVTDHIVATVADQSGVLARSMVAWVRQQTPLDRSTGEELLLRLWGFQHRPTADGHAELRGALEARLAIEPDNPNLLGMLAHMYMVEHSLWYNPRPDPLGRAQRAARRAIEIDAGNQQGWETLAMTCFYLGDRAGLNDAAERAIRINPRNANTIAWMGAMFGKAGEYDRACALVERAMTINPGHPGYLHLTIFDRHFARGEFAEALAAAQRVNIPDFMWMHFAIAAAAGQLGAMDDARAGYAEMIRLAPPLADEANRREFVTRWYWPPEMIAALLEGVAKAHGVPGAPNAP
jgi:non-specific serine/threonine protein kinase